MNATADTMTLSLNQLLAGDDQATRLEHADYHANRTYFFTGKPTATTWRDTWNQRKDNLRAGLTEMRETFGDIDPDQPVTVDAFKVGRWRGAVFAGLDSTKFWLDWAHGSRAKWYATARRDLLDIYEEFNLTPLPENPTLPGVAQP